MNLTDGVFELAADLCVGKGFTEEALLAAVPSARVSISNGPHRSYTLPGETMLAGRNFTSVLYFTGGNLAMIHLFPCASAITGWDDWSEAGVLADKARNDEWIKRATGRSPVYSAPWGSLGSYHDAKGGFALVVVDFRG